MHTYSHVHTHERTHACTPLSTCIPPHVCARAPHMHAHEDRHITDPALLECQQHGSPRRCAAHVSASLQCHGSCFPQSSMAGPGMSPLAAFRRAWISLSFTVHLRRAAATLGALGPFQHQARKLPEVQAPLLVGVSHALAPLCALPPHGDRTDLAAWAVRVGPQALSRCWWADGQMDGGILAVVCARGDGVLTPGTRRF